ncbi:hypothetical protein P43SY_010254 [Pythium insidiosum]|uniref:Uncharacterized protein n=1 Tax=Pythium insidiosum TaxID=114742 RepID=A0AAD5L8R4_PYTIN|nr:hypothetical protein P43SY_010254 [Pythium insidiosum]
MCRMPAPPSTTAIVSTPQRPASSLVAAAMHMRRAQRLGVDAKSFAVIDDQDRCRYPSKFCGNKRAVKSTGRLHRFCEHHRRRANQNQKRWAQMRRAAPSPSPSPSLSSRLLPLPSTSTMRADSVAAPVTNEWDAHDAVADMWNSECASPSSATCDVGSPDAWCTSPVSPASPSHPAAMSQWSFVEDTYKLHKSWVDTGAALSDDGSDSGSDLSSDEITTLLALLNDEEQQFAMTSFATMPWAPSQADAAEMLFASSW